VHYHVDGYNLAHWLAGDDDLLPLEMRQLLNAALSARLPADAESVHIYWDLRNPAPGIPANEYLGWCTAHNVPDADAAIIDAIYAQPAPHEHIVVSRDREVTGKSRQLGAGTWEPRDLLGDVGGRGVGQGGGRRGPGKRGGKRRGKGGRRGGRR
jgi:hypothetical protein